jgi:hypothetical protein
MNSNSDIAISANFQQYLNIRNTHAIGNYSIVKKRKYMKRLDTKEYVLECINTKGYGWVAFNDYWIADLMSPNNFKYVDEYINTIQLYVEKTTTVNKDVNLYYDVWKLCPSYIPGSPEFCHNGCFYLAMIFLGYEYKLLPKGYMGFYCKIKSNITLL